MTIKITTALSTDQTDWDRFIFSHQGSSPYHLFAWGTAIKQAYGHQPFYLMAKQDNELVGVLPLVHLKLSFFLNELVALPFCDVGNCLAVNEKVEEKLLQKTLQLGKTLKAKNIQLRGVSANNYSNSSFSPTNSNKVRMLLELPESSEALLKSFKSKLRSQIRKAEKNGVVFRWADQDGVDAFYSVFCKNMRDLGSPVHSYRWFKAIMKNYGEKARIGVAEYQGECIGSGIILSTNKQTAIPWASTLREHNRLSPNMLLYWNFLKFAADNDKNIFDFGRSTTDEGTYRFKKQWGAQPEPLIWYSSPPQNEPAGDTQNNSRKIIENMWRKAPLPVANLIGPHLRKYISL